jgi:hypothetical protein
MSNKSYQLYLDRKHIGGGSSNIDAGSCGISPGSGSSFKADPTDI